MITKQKTFDAVAASRGRQVAVFFRAVTSVVNVFAALTFAGPFGRAAESGTLDLQLREKRIPDEVRTVIGTFVRATASGDEIDAMIGWAKAGFPDLRFGPGYWKVDTANFELGLFCTVDFFLLRKDRLAREREFFRLLDEWPHLRGLGATRRQLELHALAYAAPASIEAWALASFESQDDKKRTSGYRIAGVGALFDGRLLKLVAAKLRDEQNESARLAFLDATAALPTGSPMAREVAGFWVRAVAVDGSLMAIDYSAELLRRSIARGDLTANDRGPILVALAGAGHPWRRTLLGRAAAALSLEKNFAVNEAAATDAMFRKFLQYYEKSRTTTELKPDDLVSIWAAWWETNKKLLSSEEAMILIP